MNKTIIWAMITLLLITNIATAFNWDDTTIMWLGTELSGSTIEDESGNNNNVSIVTGGMTINATGNYIQSDGTGYLNITKSGQMALLGDASNNQYAWGGWVYNLAPNNARFFRETAGFSFQTWRTDNAGDRTRTNLYDGVNDKSWYSSDGTDNYDDEWHHFIFARNNQNVTVYVDGIAQTSSSQTILDTTGAGNLHIFADQAGANRLENTGGFYGIFIVNTSITTQNATDIYNGGVRNNPMIPPSDLIIQVLNIWNSTPLNNANGTINGTFFTANATGHIVTNITNSDSPIINFTLSAPAHTTQQFTNQNISADLTKYLTGGSAPVISITANNYLGIKLGNIITINNYTSSSVTSNPYEESAANFINSSHQNNSVTYNITDLSYYHRPYTGVFNLNPAAFVFAINMTPNELVLNFSATTKGQLIEAGGNPPKIRNFSDTSLLAVQQNLSKGIINVVFNMDSSEQNWTQYYEYNNQYANHTTDTLQLISKDNLYTTWIKIIDEGSRNIEEARIRAWQGATTPTGARANFTLIGQRLSNPEGETSFFTDQNTHLCLGITAENYKSRDGTNEFCFWQYDYTTSQDDPLTIVMEQETNPTLDGVRFHCSYARFRNTVDTIPCGIMALDYDKIEVQTEYRKQQNFNKTDITNLNKVRDVYRFNLTDGTWYDKTSGNNITISVWLDDTFWKNWTIQFNSINATEIFDDDTIKGLDRKLLSPVMHIMIILLALGAGMIFNQSNAGYITYMTGLIFMPLLNPAFTWLVAIPLLLLISRIIKRMVTD